jgi:hypothetical protein
MEMMLLPPQFSVLSPLHGYEHWLSSTRAPLMAEPQKQMP